MKNYKKLLVLSVSALMVFGIASCDKPTPSESVQPSEPSNTESVVVDSNNYAEEIAAYVFSGEKDKVSRMEDFNLPTVQQTYDTNDNPILVNISWELKLADGAPTNIVTLGEPGETNVAVNVNYLSNTEAELPFSLVGKFSDSNGNTAEITLNLNVPKFAVNTYEEYVAACAANDGETNITIKGYIIGKNSSTASSGFGSMYIQDEDGHGYYAYKPVLTGIETAEALEEAYPDGAEVIVSGTVTTYNGQQEYNKQCTVMVTGNTAESNNVELAYADATAAFGAAKTATDAETLNAYQNARVTLKDCTLTSNDGKYYYFTVPGSDIEFNVYKSDYFLTEEQNAALFANWVAGYTADISGIVSVYSNLFQIYPDSVDSVKITSTEISNESVLNAGIKAIDDAIADTFAGDASVELPATDAAGIAYTYSVKEGSAGIAVSDGKLVVTQASSDQVGTLVVKASLNGEDKEVELTIKVLGTAVIYYVENPVADVEYRLGFEATNGVIKYTNGQMSGYYGSSVDNYLEGVIAKLVTVDGGYNVAITVDGATKYINVEVSGTYTNFKIQDTASSVYTWDATLGTLVTEISGTKYFFGSNGTYGTFGAYKYDAYDATKHWPAHFYDATNYDIAPAVDKAYKLGFNNASGTLYSTGAMSGYYGASTNSGAEAVDAKLVAVDGGYNVAITVEGATKYINIEISGTYTNFKIQDTAATVYTWDTKLDTLVTEIDGTKYFFGSNGTYGTFGAYKYDSYDATKHWPAHFYTVEAQEEQPGTGEGGEGQPDDNTPSVDGAVATFTFGANGSAAHVDGNDLGASKSYTDGEYTLALTMTKVYGPAYDATGNSCIKLGTSKLTGSISFTAPADVDKVIINVAKYKNYASIVDVNGTQYTLTKNSNDGEYDVIEVDVSTNKEVTLTTVTGGVRCMIDSISFISAA